MLHFHYILTDSSDRRLNKEQQRLICGRRCSSVSVKFQSWITSMSLHGVGLQNMVVGEGGCRLGREETGTI